MDRCDRPGVGIPRGGASRAAHDDARRRGSVRGSVLARHLLHTHQAAAPSPRSTADLIARLRECPTYPPMLAQSLALDLADPGSFAGFHAVAQRAYRGALDLDALADAYRQAMGPAARNRGAIFMHAIKLIVARNGRST